MRLSMSAGAGLALAVDLLAFGETGRKAAFYCRFLFVPSLFPLFFSLSVRLRPWSTVPRFWLSGSGSISAALVGLGVCWRSCLRRRCRAGSGSSGVPLLGLISGRLCRWCCLRVSLRLSPLLRLALRPLRCCLRVSRRSRVQCCGALPVLGWETMQANRI